jgi:predicted adenylyl cyclase CyaB
MPANIEIKARIHSVEQMLPVVASIASEGPYQLHQDDTFFHSPNGRLKLREFADGSAELIFYRRDDVAGPKSSFYVRTPVPDPDGLKRALTLAWGEAGRIRKTRTLYLSGRTRIHLDVVEGRGHFLELEVVLQDGEEAASGQSEAETIMRQLRIVPEMLVEGAYIDLPETHT